MGRHTESKKRRAQIFQEITEKVGLLLLAMLEDGAKGTESYIDFRIIQSTKNKTEK